MNPKDTIRIAMVGAGNMASVNHYPVLASFDDVEFAGICDIDSARMNAVADRFEIEDRFDDARKMVEATHPDGIFVIAQPQYVYDLWVWCLQQRLNLFVEKPLGLTMHHAESLAHLAEENRCITQVGFQRRVAPLLVQMRRQCLQKGPIVHATCEFIKCRLGSFPAAPGHWLNDGIHAVDTVRWMCGGEVVGIESYCKRVDSPDINWIQATVHFDNGSTGLVLCSFCSGRRLFRVQMHAPGIFVEADPEADAVVYADNDTEGRRITTQAAAGSSESWDYKGHRAKDREFIDSIKTGREQTSSPFRDAVKTMQVAHTVLAQDQVHPPPPCGGVRGGARD